MTKASIRLPTFPELQTFCGLSISDYFVWLAANNPLEIVSEEEQASLIIDGRFLALSNRTLSAAIVNGRTVKSASGIPVLHFSSDPKAGEPLTLPPDEDRPVSDLTALTIVESEVRRRLALEWTKRGVHIIDPATTFIDAAVHIGKGSKIWPNTVLKGQTSLGVDVEVQLGCWIEDSTIGDGALIKPNSVCSGALVGSKTQVGPMAHLRPGTVLGDQVKVGNFVEIKKSQLQPGAKASHLSYIGDAFVGAEANIGAGTITCNYDGYGKHTTTIGPKAFIGSNTALVAPVTIGAGAIIGAGSTISKNIPDDALAVERAPVRVLEGKAPPLHERNRLAADKARK